MADSYPKNSRIQNTYPVIQKGKILPNAPYYYTMRAVAKLRNLERVVKCTVIFKKLFLSNVLYLTGPEVCLFNKHGFLIF